MAPVVDEFPKSTAESDAQVIAPAVIVAPGETVSLIIIVDAADVQPLVGSVTVRLYVPVVLTVRLCSVEAKLLGPDHL